MNIVNNFRLNSFKYQTNKSQDISFASHKSFEDLEPEEQLDQLAQHYYYTHSIPLFSKSNKPNSSSNRPLINYLNSHLAFNDCIFKTREVTPNFVVGQNLTYDTFFKEDFSVDEAINKMKQSGIDTIVYFHNNKSLHGKDYEKLANKHGLNFINMSPELDETLAKHKSYRGTQLEKEFINYFSGLCDFIKNHKVYAGCDLSVARTSVMLYYLSALNPEVEDTQLKNILNCIITTEINDNFKLLQENKIKN